MVDKPVSNEMKNMIYTNIVLFDGDVLVACDLKIDYQFRQASVQPSGPVEWYGIVLPPTSRIQLQKRYTLRIPNFSSCEIQIKALQPDGAIEFRGIGNQPSGLLPEKG